MTTEEQHRYLVKRRADAKAHLGGVCKVCGTDRDLQFDHIDPMTKVAAIANAIAWHWSWERLLVELAKCQLLCRPHHLKKSIREGSLATYNKQACVAESV